MMHAMLLSAPGQALVSTQLPIPVPQRGQLLIKVRACGVCRTDLHVVDGELPQARYPIVPGHQVVGTVAGIGANLNGFAPGQRVGIPWLGYSCGHCEYCCEGRENLCGEARYTGCQIDGGFADYCVADARYCFALPASYDDAAAAPLLCAGLIGYRALRLAGPAQHIGFMGFGASAHLLCQVAVATGRSVYAFTRPGASAAQDFARGLGAVWAGASGDTPPRKLDAVIIFAAAGDLVPEALRLCKRGGRVVCAGIHMSEIPAFAYALLWEERSLCSVANLTRLDGIEFLQLAATLPLRIETRQYAMHAANAALDDLRHGRFNGAAVLMNPV
ncbi:MAG: hypothetical protein RLZZ227_340 [Pseudomonadota bacterium]